MTKQYYGLLGWPVKHSVSPEMQEAGFRAAGIDAGYELIEVPPAELAAKVDAMKAEGFHGWNVTVPHKTAMMELADDIEPTARCAGSVNTILNQDGCLKAYSTDGYGLEMSVQESFDLGLPGRHVLFWGAGGAARATSVYFASRGVSRLTIVNRTRARAEALAETIHRAAPDCWTQVLDLDASDVVHQALTETDLIIQATSIGLHQGDPSAIPENLLEPGMRIIDMIYRPTALQKAARRIGCEIADGRGMLLYQGVRSFELWTGVQDPPVEAMRAGLERALKV